MTKKTPAIIGLIAAGALAACERTEDRVAATMIEGAISTTGRSADVDVNRAEGRIAVEMAAKKRPQGWPDDIPILAKAIGPKVLKSDVGEQRIRMFLWDPPPTLLDDYAQALRNEGWKTQPGNEGIEASKVRRSLVVEARRSGDHPGRIELRGTISQKEVLR